MSQTRRIDDMAKEWVKDPAFRKAYEARAPEYALAAALIEARMKAKMTQKEIARRMKTTQPVIARMEGGRQMPNARALFAFAKATGTRLEIRFVDR